MKKIVFLLFLPVLIYSQKVNFNDIEYTHIHKLNQCQDYFIEKNYKFLGEKDYWLPGIKQYVFTSKIGKIQFYFMIDETTGETGWVEIIMGDATNFLELKNKINNKYLNFTLAESQDVNDPLSTKFINGVNTIIFTSFKDDNLGLVYKISYW